MDINLTNKKQFNLKPFLRAVKYISIGCSVVTIVGLAIHPLINNNSSEKTKDKENKITSELTPAPYTIFIGQKEDEAIIKFHNQNSELHLKNINVEEYNCLLNGRGVDCVLKKAYQPRIKILDKEVESTSKAEIDQQSSEIKINKNTIDNVVVVIGVVLFFFLISKFRNK